MVGVIIFFGGFWCWWWFCARRMNFVWMVLEVVFVVSLFITTTFISMITDVKVVIVKGLVVLKEVVGVKGATILL